MCSTKPFILLDHVQLAMPAGGEELARAFYVGLLGMEELVKPSALAGRGGAWFASGDIQVHLGVDPEFKAAKKAHPAFRCRDYQQLIAKLRAGGVEVKPDDTPFADGSQHAYISDPFGNRIELIQ